MNSMITPIALNNEGFDNDIQDLPAVGRSFMWTDLVTRTYTKRSYRDLSSPAYTISNAEKEFICDELTGVTNYLKLGKTNHAVTTLEVCYRLKKNTLYKWLAMRKKGLSFGTNIKGGPIPKLDIIALEKLREDLVAKKEATGFWRVILDRSMTGFQSKV